MIIVDGQTYLKEEDAPNLGSLKCMKATYAPGGSNEKQIREYFGSEDDCKKVANKTIKIDYVATGSILLSDEGNVWMFNEVTKEWKSLTEK